MVIFSGIQPTGRKHLGNYIGAIIRTSRGRSAATRRSTASSTCTRSRSPTTRPSCASASTTPPRCWSPPGSTPSAASSSARATSTSTPSCAGCSRAVTARRRAQPDAPVPRQVGRAARAGVRRAALLPRAAGGRRARLPRARGAGRRGPARAPRAHARRRRAVQRALRRDLLVVPEHRIPDGRRAGARPPGARRARCPRPAGTRAGHGVRARRARRHPAQVPARRDRLRPRHRPRPTTSRASRT